jgi:uncharacterized membrane protein
MKKKIVLLISLFLLLSFVSAFANTGGVDGLTTVKGKVVEIIAHSKPADLNAGQGSLIQEQQIVKVRVLSGEFQGREYLVENNMGNNEYYNIRVEEGDDILLVLDTTSDQMQVYISGFARDKYEMIIILIFVLLLLAVGRVKGLKSVITLSITLAVILKVIIPAIINGINPIIISVAGSIVITVLTLTIVSGFNRKSLSAILGTLSGVFIAGGIAYIIGTLSKLTGLNSEEAVMLIYIPGDIDLNLKGILFAGILIGTLGAVMDVSMSIASSMHEIKTIKSDISRKDLFKSGMNVGRDIMGTMSNTLILAYTGASIPILIIFTAYNISFVEIINLDIMATEIIRAVAGSIGIVLSIPLTAAITVFTD